MRESCDQKFPDFTAAAPTLAWVPLREGMLEGDTEEDTRTSNQEECHSADIVPMRGIKKLQTNYPYWALVDSFGALYIPK